MAEAKNRSRILILSYLAQFSLQRRFGDVPYGGLRDCAFEGDSDDVAPGDLVALSSVSPSKWYLGWLTEKTWPEGWACEQYTIESIEDGELCNWTNVGMSHYNRKTVGEHPEWRWTDAQHEFKDLWWSVCYKEKDAYMHLPMNPVFDGDAVQLAVRARHSFSETIVRHDFVNWRKTTKKMMASFYDDAKAQFDAERPARQQS